LPLLCCLNRGISLVCFRLPLLCGLASRHFSCLPLFASPLLALIEAFLLFPFASPMRSLIEAFLLFASVCLCFAVSHRGISLCSSSWVTTMKPFSSLYLGFSFCCTITEREIKIHSLVSVSPAYRKSPTCYL
jgi:hypothetical protein